MSEAPGRGDVRLLFVGLTTSMFGDCVLLLALGIWTKSLTGSTSMAGLAMLAVVALAPLAPALGWLVDRFRRRRFLIVGNLAAGAALCPLFLVRDRGDVWLLLAVCVLYGVSFIVLDAALGGLLKELVPDEALAGANGLRATIREVLRLVGPLIGAGLFAAFGPVPMVALDVASFVVAALAVAGLRLREQPPVPPRRHWLAEMAQGGRYLRREPALRRATIAVALGMLMLGAIETISFAYVDQGLHRSSPFLGVLVTAQAIGGVLGGSVAAAVVRRTGELGALALGLLAMAAGMALMAFPSLVLAFVALPVDGVGLPLVVVALNTLVQRRTPAPLMGRVSAVAGTLTDAPQALSIAVSAVLVSIVDYRLLLVGIAVVVGTVAIGVWRSRRLTTPATAVTLEGTAPAEASRAG
jgi:MFS family permease